MLDFSTRMNNRFQFSSCEAPQRPTTKERNETLAVELREDLLTITQVREDGSLGSRIYAQRTLDLAGVTTFVILPELPSRVRDGSFFPLSAPPRFSRRTAASDVGCARSEPTPTAAAVAAGSSMLWRREE